MIQEQFQGYIIKSRPVKTANDRFAVTVIIEKDIDGKLMQQQFFADDKIYYILEIEAAKECLNLGRNLIKLNMIGF